LICGKIPGSSDAARHIGKTPVGTTGKDRDLAEWGSGFQEETMRNAPFAGLMGMAAAAVVASTALAQVEPAGAPVRANEITRALKGKVCTSRVGATFAFGKDGHYSYDGLWTDHGHYSIHDGAVTILLDSGLERDFAISKRDGILFMEETAVSCTRGSPVGRVHVTVKHAQNVLLKHEPADG
jgi:hypothetical protein